MDDEFEAHYHFSVPLCWAATDMVVNKVKRLIETKQNTAIKLPLLTELSAAKADGKMSLWSFSYGRLCLMYAHALAVAPEWDKTQLSTLLEYHAFVMKKVFLGRNGNKGRWWSC